MQPSRAEEKWSTQCRCRSPYLYLPVAVLYAVEAQCNLHLLAAQRSRQILHNHHGSAPSFQRGIASHLLVCKHEERRARQSLLLQQLLELCLAVTKTPRIGTVHNPNLHKIEQILNI
jgi:hypothetical protein